MKNDQNKTLFETIEYESIVRNMFMVDVAKDIGISSVSLYSLKKKRPSRRTYHKIAIFLNKDIDEVMQLPITR